jgi:hypothetical protein
MVIMPPLIPNVQGKGDPGFSSGSGGSSPPAEWVPTDIAGCVLWLPPDIAYFYTDSAGTAEVTSNGDPVGRWEDASGVGNNATQGTAGSRPAYTANVQNSLPMMLFDGSADHLRDDALAVYFDGEDAAVTIAIVIKKSSNVGFDGPFAAGSSASATPYVRIYSNGTTRVLRKVDDAASGAAPNYGTEDTSTHLHLIRLNGTTADVWVDSTQVLTGQAFNVGTVTLNRFALGAFVSTSTGDYMHGYIGEVIVWDNAISNTDATTVRTELIAKWGL